MDVVTSTTRTGENKAHQVIALSMFLHKHIPARWPCFGDYMNVVHFPLLLLAYFTANSSLLVRDLGRWLHLGWWSHWLRTLPSKACLQLMEPIQNWLQPSHDALYLTHKHMNDSCLPELCQERFRKKKTETDIAAHILSTAASFKHHCWQELVYTAWSKLIYLMPTLRRSAQYQKSFILLTTFNLTFFFTCKLHISNKAH